MITDAERLARVPPEVLRWFLDQVAGVDFPSVRDWRIHHGLRGCVFRIERVQAGAVKVVDLQVRRSP